LIIEHKLANRVWELIALPLAFESASVLARGRTDSLDRIRGRTQFMRSNVGNQRRLSGRIRSIPFCPTQVSGRGVSMTARRASLGHRNLATHPGVGLFNGMTRPRVLRSYRLEER
jgi:hypothetical protein